MDGANTDTSPSFNSPPFQLEAYENDLQSMSAAAKQGESQTQSGSKGLRKLDRFEVKDSDDEDEDLGSADENLEEDDEEEEEEEDASSKIKPAKKHPKAKGKSKKNKKKQESDEPDKKTNKRKTDDDDDDEESDDEARDAVLSLCIRCACRRDSTIFNCRGTLIGAEERQRPRTKQED